MAAACGKSAPAKPEADPEAMRKIARDMVAYAPGPGTLPECKDGDLSISAPTMTHARLLKLAGVALSDRPEHADWINADDLDHPAAIAMTKQGADPKTVRQAAAELLAAPSYIVYRVDIVDAPIALFVKELKRETIGARVIRYGKDGRPTCATVFYAQDSEAKSEWAIAKSDRALIDPEVAQAMRDDLRLQYIKAAPRPK